MENVPAKTVVYRDAIIRTFRKLKIDLQKEVHEDIASNFNLDPNLKNSV